jgi:hypothetical protein
MVHAVRAVSRTVPGVLRVGTLSLVVAGVFIWRSGLLVLRVCAMAGAVSSMGRVAVLVALIVHRVFLFHRITSDISHTV